MIELKFTIKEQAGGRITIRHQGRDVGMATEAEVDVAQCVKQIIRDTMQAEVLGELISASMPPAIIIDTTKPVTNPHQNS